MAQKISIEDYKKQKINAKNDKIKLILFIANGVLLISTITLTILYIVLNTNSVSKEECDMTIDDKNSTINWLESDSETLTDILNGHDSNYVKEKLEFLDDNIVMKIEGYGNYYYSYDCMMKKVGNKSYSYWTYNIKEARDAGLKEGSCK